MENFYDSRITVIKSFKRLLNKNKMTKKAFCEKANISRPTLDLFLSGEMSNSNIFNTNVIDFSKVLNINPDTLLNEVTEPVKMVSSSNCSKDYEMSLIEKKQFRDLEDICKLYRIYF